MKISKQKSAKDESLKSAKEITVARIAARGAISVALIGVVSVGLTLLASRQRSDGPQAAAIGEEIGKKIGYYAARKLIVVSALLNKEQELRSMSEQAQRSGRVDVAADLEDLADRTRSVRSFVDEQHQKHVEAMMSGNGLAESKTITETNEPIVALNVVLVKREMLNAWLRGGASGQDKDTERGGWIYVQGNLHEIFHAHPKPPIPLYGKGSTNSQEQSFQVENVEETFSD